MRWMLQMDQEEMLNRKGLCGHLPRSGRKAALLLHLTTDIRLAGLRDPAERPHPPAGK